MPQTFIITDSHLAAFSQQQQQRFEAELAQYLQREYSTESKRLGRDRLQSLIRTGIDRAKGYNILLERDVTRYIELMLALCPDFDQSDRTPWAREILRQPHLTGDAKISRIYEQLAFSPQ